MHEALEAEKRALCERRTSVSLAGALGATNILGVANQNARKKRHNPVPASSVRDDPAALRTMEPNKKKHLGW